MTKSLTFLILAWLQIATLQTSTASALRWLASTPEKIEIQPNRCELLFKVDPTKLGQLRPEYLRNFKKTPTYQVKDLTAIDNQFSWGGCWLYGMNCAIESSIKKEFKIEVDISESFLEVLSMHERMAAAVWQPGSSLVQGGNIETAAWLIQTYGMVPRGAYTPRVEFISKENSKQIEKMLNARLAEHYYAIDPIVTQFKNQIAALPTTEIVKIQSLTDKMNLAVKPLAEKAFKDLQDIIHLYSGPLPTEFVENGVKYTPLTYAEKYFPKKDGTITKVYPKRDELPPLLREKSSSPKNTPPTPNKKPTYSLDDEGLIRPMDKENPNQIFVTPAEALVMLKTEVDKGVAVPFAFEVSGHHMDNTTGICSIDAFYSYEGFKPPSQNYRMKFGQFDGGHMVAAVGYQLDSKGEIVWIKFKNSWGTDAGDQGFYYMDKGYFEEYFLEMYQQTVKAVDRPTKP